MTQYTIQMEIIPGIADDFKLFAGWTADGLRRNFIRKIGQIFWLRSIRTNIFEGPYIFTESTNADDLKIYLENNMVFIPKHPLDTKIQTIKEENILKAV